MEGAEGSWAVCTMGSVSGHPQSFQGSLPWGHSHRMAAAAGRRTAGSEPGFLGSATSLSKWLCPSRPQFFLLESGCFPLPHGCGGKENEPGFEGQAGER